MSTQSLRSRPERVVLIVEDEPLLRASMARGLGRLTDVTVLEAGSVREALRVLESVEPALVLSDLDLPDGSGIELAAFLDKRPARAPVVFVSAYVGRYRAQLERRGDVEIYEKPLPLERLRSIVEDNLDAGVRDSTPFSVADYVQLAAMGRHSVVLSVRGPRAKGQIVIERGETRRAVDNLGEGKDAFRRMAFSRSASIQCRSFARGETFEANVEGSCESLLLDAARVHDESSLDDLDLDWEAPSGPAETGTPLPLSGARETRRFTELYDDGIDALLAKDYRRAFEAFRAASELEPDDPRVRANLARLREMGHGS